MKLDKLHNAIFKPVLCMKNTCQGQLPGTASTPPTMRDFRLNDFLRSSPQDSNKISYKVLTKSKIY